MLDLIHLFHQGGPVMYLLLLSSIIAGAVIVERLAYYRRMKMSMAEYSASAIALLDNGEIEKLQKRYSNGQRPLELITMAGVKAWSSGRCIEQAMENAAQLAAANLRRGLNVLSTLVTLSPLFGLMGTVIGMIQSFRVFDLQNGAPMAITAGVGEALVATASGLAVAVIALIGHSCLSYKLDGLITDMERASGLVTEHLPVKNCMGRSQHEAA